MTETEQQIALCEWMEWRKGIPQEDDYEWMHADGCGTNYLPDTNSLDVLHEMEKKLTQVQYNEFRLLLEFRHGHEAISASASQRREALLRALKL